MHRTEPGTAMLSGDIYDALLAALPNSVFTDEHPTFSESINSYWSQNACECRPSCIVRPANTHEVSTAIKVLRARSDATGDGASPVKFAVRSGGHSPEAGFASLDGGVVMDLALLNQVELSNDKSTVTVGVGARWRDVSSKLDGEGLAMIGGRNSSVGVGGLVLGGGISFFSPRFGMVCDNIDIYEIVLADGTVTNVSASQNSDLWKALKGGTGNFGIVTRVTAKTFPTDKIWAGYVYFTTWQVGSVLKAFAEFNEPRNFDPYAAGPILGIAYVQKLGISLIACNLTYTKPQAWAPVYSGFNSLWRMWSTHKIQPLSDATNELVTFAPSGDRQFQATMTIKNDLPTFLACYGVFSRAQSQVKSARGAVGSLVFQPLSATVTRKGSPNVLGLETRDTDETLIIVLVCVSWADRKDDELMHQWTRDIISSCETIAEARGTADRYRYLNYAASGQDPFASYGEANHHFLKEMSSKYDPERFFQRAKQGGFKLID